MPTTGGSVLLEGSIPPDDAFVVKKLRAAGAIILAKVNMSEFASGARPQLARRPVAQSARSRAHAVGIVGRHRRRHRRRLRDRSAWAPTPADRFAVRRRPTASSVSSRRTGCSAATASFRSRSASTPAGRWRAASYDVAVALGVMTGVDPADAATKKSEGKFETDYTKFLKADALKGARIGVARDFIGADPDVDWVVDSALDAMRKAGATHRRRALSQVAARREGRVLQRGPLSRIPGADRRLPRARRAEVSEERSTR